MEILIHTYGRHKNQVTWWNLPAEIQRRASLVVQERERDLYYDDYPIIVLPDHIRKLADTRQYLFETREADRICILDDDLDFAVRRTDDPTKFREAEPKDVLDMFETIEGLLEIAYSIVGVAAREGANRNIAPYLYRTRQMRIHAINVQTYRRLGIRFDRVEVMEDFDVTLQFLEAGYSNVVLNNYVTNQRGSNTEGGCSHYRTLECQEAAANRLAELHPGIVKVVKKKTKTSWGGQERTDVIVGWKKAYGKGRS
jgi:hypothetical protein